ncbi:ABC transporter ATP-binding protein [Stutzerimonas kirkiae]|nr:ABC transporter ATP-binding protein [Stutzerimonas kirkiae]TBV14275.1 ABC transporter ATP-binding protein [Stutzerimonas kirkiae]
MTRPPPRGAGPAVQPSFREWHAVILQMDQVEVLYEQVILAVRDVSLEVAQGEIVALLGANGAGKSTTLKAISNLLRGERGEVAKGRIFYRGEDITQREPGDLVRAGLVQVLEGRHCFAHLSVEENLRIGAFANRPSRRQLKQGLERIYDYFPRLKERRKSLTGYTSGGEQQMVAIGRALIANPALVLLDEPSMGLAPQIVEEIFEIVAALNRNEGVSFLVAEQNINVTLHYAQRGYVLESGTVVGQGSAAELAAREDIHELYLGGTLDLAS